MFFRIKNNREKPLGNGCLFVKHCKTRHMFNIVLCLIVYLCCYGCCDLYLSGFRIIGSVECSQGGHLLTNQLLRKLFKDNSNFSLLEVKEKVVPNAFVNRAHLRSIA